MAHAMAAHCRNPGRADRHNRPIEAPVSCAGEAASGVGILSDDRDLGELNRFLAAVERRALRIAEIGVGDRDDAHDIVQLAMIRLARTYGDRDAVEWTPLFYRILQNAVRDHHRRNAVRRRVMAFFGRADDGAEAYDPVETAADPGGRTPDQLLENAQAMQGLETALRRLPARQREAFMLRTFEGLDIAGTALAMGVTEGSVKTHYFRAMHSLRQMLGEHWE
jgi:RNA polymerase sigma-70 factor, ECF subfamily